MNFFLLLISVAIAAYAMYSINRKQKTIQALKAKQLSLNHSVRQLQQTFKENVAVYSEHNLIDTEQRRLLVSVANNYFVFQPVNTINLSHLSDLVDLFTQTTELFAELTPDQRNEFTTLLIDLCAKLPTETRGCSAIFYASDAPSLFYDLLTHTQELTKEPEPITLPENEHETETDAKIEGNDAMHLDVEQAS